MQSARRTTMPFPTRSMPNLARVQKHLHGERIADVRGEIHQRILGAGLRTNIRPGARIAITAGSRGMGGFLDLLSGIADALAELGAKPLIVPAMGSHGGATSDGQVEILKRLGVTDFSLNAPIEATMETLELGATKTGAAAHLDRIAANADGIIVLGRVKTHPENTQGIASGLLKMVTVGLGKQIGAQEAHSHGLWPSVEQVPEITLAKSKILLGVGVVENAFRQPAIIEVVPATYEAFRDCDRRLLEAAKAHVASIPFDRLDLLIVDEIGKDISGTGMDLNVIGKWRIDGGERKPDFHRIVALSLTSASLGNGLGIGLADFTTERLMREYDPMVTYVNLITSTEPGSMNTREGPPPLALATDREAIELALHTALAGNQPRICRIKNTASLHEFWVSESHVQEVKTSPRLKLITSPAPMEYDANGQLF